MEFLRNGIQVVSPPMGNIFCDAIGIYSSGHQLQGPLFHFSGDLHHEEDLASDATLCFLTKKASFFRSALDLPGLGHLRGKRTKLTICSEPLLLAFLFFTADLSICLKGGVTERER